MNLSNIHSTFFYSRLESYSFYNCKNLAERKETVLNINSQKVLYYSKQQVEFSDLASNLKERNRLIAIFEKKYKY